MRSSRGVRITGRLIVGLFLMALGVLFTLDNLGYLYAEDYLVYWPAILIAVGLAKLLAPGAAPAARGWGAVWAAAGLWLLLYELRLVVLDPLRFWPVVLVLVGIGLIVGALRRRRPAASDAGSTVSAFALLSGNRRTSTSRQFRGGDLTAVMGGCRLDLTGAVPAADGAVVDVFAFWGGIEIVVPPSWTVESRVVPLLGGVDDRTRPPAAADRRLTVKGFSIMSGVEVKNPGAGGEDAD